MPYVKRDWKMWTELKICPKCEYYNECLMEHDCEAMKILVKIYENLDCSDPDE